MRKVLTAVFLLLVLGLLSPEIISATEDGNACAVYFTGIGCPHCTKVESFIHEQLLEKYPNLKIIEYEIYQEQANASLLYEYNTVYNSGLGIPLIIF